MAIHKLNLTRINRLIKQGKKGKHGDGGNLWLQVAGIDVASWLFRWKDPATKKDRSIFYGPWHTISLEEARVMARADRKLLLSGKDPKKARDDRILAQQIKEGKAKTVRQVVDEFTTNIVEHNARNTQIGTKRRMRIVNRNIGDMPFAKVTVQTILDDPHVTPDGKKVVQPGLGLSKLWVKQNPNASALQLETAQLFAYGIDKGYKPDGYNPALFAHLKRLLPKRARVHRTKHHPGVPFKKMGQFMEELRDYHYRGHLVCYEGRPPIALCIEWIALTGCRPGEARLAKFKEIDDLENPKIWTVPPENLKIKHGETKRVPITKPMLAVLKHAKKTAYPSQSSQWMDSHKGRGAIFPRARHTPDCSPDALIFPNSVNEPYNEAMLARFMRTQMGKWKPARPHGFRTSLKDWWAANEFQMHLWEIQVDHHGSKLKRSYGTDLLEERRGKMELWGEYCSKRTPEPKAGEVINLAKKRRPA